jgi:hypothetical protein
MRDVFNALHQSDEHLVLIGSARRETHPAVAHHNGRDAMGRRGDEPILPGSLAIVVRMDVDEPGRDDPAVGVNLVAGTPLHLSYGDDATARDGNIGFKRLSAGSIDD